MKSCGINNRNGGYPYNNFIQPDDVHVMKAVREIQAESGYNNKPLVYNTRVYIDQRVRYRRDIGDYWQFPYETLRRGLGDCEDMAFLHASIYVHFLGSQNVRTVWGMHHGQGHMWVEVRENGRWYVIEPTNPKMPVIPVEHRWIYGYSNVIHYIYESGCSSPAVYKRYGTPNRRVGSSSVGPAIAVGVGIVALIGLGALALLALGAAGSKK